MTWDELYEKCQCTNGSGRDIFTVAALEVGDLIWAYDNAPDYETVFEPLGNDRESIANRIMSNAASRGGDKYEEPITEENLWLLDDAVEFLRNLR